MNNNVFWFCAVFNYDAKFHNVLQVALPDFHSCNSSSPLATYSTGNDSITITSPGHYYYTCGFVGHCEAGQKVDIRVPKALQPTAVPVSSPIRAPPSHKAVPTTSPSGSFTPSPSQNRAESLLPFDFCSKIVLFLLVFGLYVNVFLWLGRSSCGFIIVAIFYYVQFSLPRIMIVLGDFGSLDIF